MPTLTKSVLRIENINLRLAQGGSITGEVVLHHWLAPSPGMPNYNVRPAGLALPSMRSWDVFIPVDGLVNAQLNDFPIDTLMPIVAPPAFYRLGLDGLINGPTKAEWSGGDIRTLRVAGQLAISPSGKMIPGEVPAFGIIDGTYYQSNSSVDLRNFDLQLPSSHFNARGRLGAYPLSSPSALNVDFHTTNFGDFDQLLRDLDFVSYNQRGAAALPIQLHGQFNYKGIWGGSILDPHMTGAVSATQISLIIPPQNTNSTKDANLKPQWLPWDSIEAEGTYSATHILVDHARLTRASGVVELSGSLDAVTGPFPTTGSTAPPITISLQICASTLPHMASTSAISTRSPEKPIPLPEHSLRNLIATARFVPSTEWAGCSSLLPLLMGNPSRASTFTATSKTRSSTSPA